MPPCTRRNNTSDSKTILAVSDIYIQKNYHTLIQAFGLVHKENPELKLVIVGREIDEFYSRSVREMANALRVTDAVEFLGHVNPSELSKLYENCHIFVFPSTVETFGNPLLEAMSFGLPIACSNTAAMPEVIGDAGLLFDPRNVADIARAIKKLHADPVLREELGISASTRAREFSLSRTATATADALRGLLSDAQNPHMLR